MYGDKLTRCVELQWKRSLSSGRMAVKWNWSRSCKHQPIGTWTGNCNQKLPATFSHCPLYLVCIELSVMEQCVIAGCMLAYYALKCWTLVCWWWWFDWSFVTTYSSSSPVVTTHHLHHTLLQWTPANPGSPGKWPLKRREGSVICHFL